MIEHPMITQINRTGYPKEMVEKHVESAKASNSQLFHIYECEDCIVTFAVEQDFEDQTVVCCPICHIDDFIRDVASGEIKIRR